jgi:hypothetical protein
MMRNPLTLSSAPTAFLFGRALEMWLVILYLIVHGVVLVASGFSLAGNEEPEKTLFARFYAPVANRWGPWMIGGGVLCWGLAVGTWMRANWAFWLSILTLIGGILACFVFLFRGVFPPAAPLFAIMLTIIGFARSNSRF